MYFYQQQNTTSTLEKSIYFIHKNDDLSNVSVCYVKLNSLTDRFVDLIAVFGDICRVGGQIVCHIIDSALLLLLLLLLLSEAYASVDTETSARLLSAATAAAAQEVLDIAVD